MTFPDFSTSVGWGTSDSKRWSGHSSYFKGNFLICSAKTERMGFEGSFSRSFHLSYGPAPGLRRDEAIPFFDQAKGTSPEVADIYS